MVAVPVERKPSFFVYELFHRLGFRNKDFEFDLVMLADLVKKFVCFCVQATCIQAEDAKS